MKKENKKWVWVGIVILIILFFFPFGAIFNLFTSSKNVEKPLTEEDFKILSASWSNYNLEWRDDNLVPILNLPEIDLESQCAYCKTGIFVTEQGFEIDHSDVVSKQERCNSGDYYLTIDSSKGISYNAAIDGINIEGLRDRDALTHFVTKGTHTIGFLLPWQQRDNNYLDITQTHDITLCAVGNRNVGDFICKSITLPAKCT